MSSMVPAVILSHRACSTCHATYRAAFDRCPLDGAPIVETDDDPLLGEQVATYTIEHLLGEGGMGRVYQAHHTRLQHRRVALKVLLGDLAAALPTRLRFTQEAEAASRLDHPNVVAVNDFGRTDTGLLFLTMELVEGRTLAQLIEEGPLNPLRVVVLARQLVAGLAHAHELGFIHRDFKPENVLVVDGPDGEVPRIVDFGLAIAADPAEQARLTSVGSTIGTPLYAAPEQIHGGTVDHRCDLFGLGVTMFEMLAGRLPYDGDLVEVMTRNMLGQIPAIADRNPNAHVPAALEALVRRLMAPTPGGRPSSAAAVLDALDQLDVAEPPDTSHAPIPQATSRRQPWRVLAIAGSTVAVVAVVAGVAIDAGGQQPTASVAVVAAAEPVLAEPSSTSPSSTSPSITSPPRIADAAELVQSRSPAPTRSAPIASPQPSQPDRRGRSSVPVQATPDAIATAAPPPRVAEPAVSAPALAASPDVLPSPPQLPPPSLPPPQPQPQPQPPSRPAPRFTTRATVRIDGVSVAGPLTRASVVRALDRALPAIRACYAPAVARVRRSPALALAARLVIDENQATGGVRVADAGLGDLSSCAITALRGVRAESAPDVGVATVDFVIRFTPELP